MRPTVAAPLSVRIALPESLLALGILCVLREQAHLDVEVMDVESEAPAVAGGGEVIITDYERGMSLARASTSAGRRSAVPARVLVLSGRDREHDIRRALEQGVRGYLSCDCSAAELSEALRTVARGQRYLSKLAGDRMANSFGRESLTDREQEVLALLAHGECNKQIARRLDIAIGTVKSHVKSVMCKLGAANRTKAICIANERGLVDVQVQDGARDAAPNGALTLSH